MSTKAHTQIQAMTLSENPKVREMAVALLAPDRTPESMLRAWHTGMDAPVRERAIQIPVIDMERRLRFSLEELLEKINAGAFKIVSKSTGQDLTDDLKLVPVPGREQDLVEVLDGDADIVVVAIGHAIEHGFPFMDAFDEVMWSNGTKLPADGLPYLNICTVHGEDCDSELDDCVLRDPSAPRLKILKPSTYVKANLHAVLERQVAADMCHLNSPQEPE